MSDPYVLLGVGPEASPAELRAAYRRRAAACHPDRGGDPERFLEVQAAFRVLADPELRRRHDADPEGVFGCELTRARLLARRKRRRARLSKLY